MTYIQLVQQLSFAAGAFYMRLVGRPMEVYNYLEPLYNDYRKLRLLSQDGSYSLSYLDELVDQMLHQDYLFDIALPRLPQRCTLATAHTTFTFQLLDASQPIWQVVLHGLGSI